MEEMPQVFFGVTDRERISNIFFGSPNRSWEVIIRAYTADKTAGRALPATLDSDDEDIIITHRGWEKH